MKKLCVIITVFNRLDYTKKTLDSLFATCPANTQYIIIDNNSEGEQMREYLTGLEDLNKHAVYRLNDNLGWGGAVNYGIDIAGIKGCLTDDHMILISNNDVIYGPGWYEKLLFLYDKYPKIGIMGVWKHIAHGVLEDRFDMVVKDQMPAVGWLITPENLKKIGTFPVHGPCATKGGNGEDVTYCIMSAQAGLLVCAPKDDVAQHIDGY